MKKKLLGSIIKRVEKIECKKNDKDKENATLKTKLDQMHVQSKNLKEENNRLKEKLYHERSLNEEHLNNLDQYGRQNNVFINGLEDTEGETAVRTTQKVVTIVNSQLPFKICENEIAISHRLGQFDTNRKRPIVVKLVRRNMKNAIMQNSKMLRGTEIYINEDLTKLNRNV